MQTYVDSIQQAAYSFPPLALAFTIPYLIYNYKKYGSIWSLRIWIVYSFILYMLCTYCLVILPLPSPEKAATLHNHQMQLLPFNFVFDILKHAKLQLVNPKSYFTLINNPAFFSTIFNIFMTLPFGFYLKYYFENNFRQVAIKSFFLSLFFELTQLSGLYFIYSGNYRLFDVDDLITNTLGGVLGFALATVLVKYLPTRKQIDEKSLERSDKISLLRRLVAMGFDLIFGGFFTVFFGDIILKSIHLESDIFTIQIPFIVYLVGSTILLRGRTLGFFMTNLKVTSNHQVGLMRTYLRYLLRYLFFMLQFVTPPLALINLLNLSLTNDILSRETMTYIVLGLLVIFALYYLITLLLVAMRKPLLYEKLSETHLTNTTKNHLKAKPKAKIKDQNKVKNSESQVENNLDYSDSEEI